jgi:hypothetical protein
MGLGRRTVIRVKRAIDDNAWRKSGDGRPRADSDTAGNTTGAGIGDGGSPQNAESLGGSKGLRPGVSGEDRQCGAGEVKCRDESRTR